MAWTIGSHHDLSGSGTIAVSGPDALAINVTTVAIRSGVKVGQPPSYFGIGHLSPGGTSGYLRDIPIQHVSQLEVLPTNEITVLGYTLQPGAEVTVTELRRPGGAAGGLMWWDRDPIPVGSADYAAPGASSGSVVMWTYTVPAGRRLLVASVNLRVQRKTVASSPTHPFIDVNLSTGRRLYARLGLNTAGAAIEDALSAHGVVMSAGHTITATRNGDSDNGEIIFSASWSGTLFDA